MDEENLYIRPRGDRVCRQCRREAAKRYYLKNKDKVKNYAKKHYNENSKYYEEYRIKNRNRSHQYNVNYRKDNLEKEKKRISKWHKENHSRVVEYARRRRALKRKALSDFEYSIIEEYRILQQGKCYYCNNDMLTDVPSVHPQKETLEHKIPLSRGGLHSIENTVLACRKCNLEKGKNTEEEFVKNKEVP